MKLSRKTNFGRLSWLMVARLSLTCDPFAGKAGETGEEDGAKKSLTSSKMRLSSLWLAEN